jgi:hypothetical protein
VTVDSVREADTVYWFDASTAPPTVRAIVEHTRLMPIRARLWRGGSAGCAGGVIAQSGRTFSACGPFCPCVVSNSTFWFSFSDL